MFEQLLEFDSVIGGLLGIAGGVMTVLVWEVFLRPVREGRTLAEVLSAEVSFNLQYLAAATLKADRKSIGGDFATSTLVFESAVGQVGLLPVQLVHEVVFLYKYFAELNGYPRAYADALRDYRSYEAGSENRAAAERELQQLIAVFQQTLTKATKRIELVQPLLVKAARPWWSIRAWRSAEPKLLDVEELKTRVARAEAERKSPPDRR